MALAAFRQREMASFRNSSSCKPSIRRNDNPRALKDAVGLRPSSSTQKIVRAELDAQAGGGEPEASSLLPKKQSKLDLYLQHRTYRHIESGPAAIGIPIPVAFAFSRS